MTAFSNEFLQDLPPKERRYDTPVAENLVFSVFPNGVKAWVHVYSYEGFVRRRTIGLFPEMDYAQAQAALSQSRRIVAVELQQGGQRRRPAGISQTKILLLVSGAIIGGVLIALMIRFLTADGRAPDPGPPAAAMPAGADRTLATAPPAGPVEEPGPEPASAPDGDRGEASGVPDTGISDQAGAGDDPALEAGMPQADPEPSPEPEPDPGQTGPGALAEARPEVPDPDAGIPEPGPQAAAQPATGDTGGPGATETQRVEAAEDAIEASDAPAADLVDDAPADLAGAVASDDAAETVASVADEPAVTQGSAADEGPVPQALEEPDVGDGAVPIPLPGTSAAESGPDGDADTGPEALVETMPPGEEPADTVLPEEPVPGTGETGAGLPDNEPAENGDGAPAIETSVRTQLTSGLADMEPTDELVSPIMVAPGGTRRVYFFTEARGLFGSRVTHRWQFEGTTLTQLPFVVAGDPWPIYSSKDIPADQAGDWEVSILGEDGTVLASESFRVGVEAP
jgi:hypothetical protein